MKKTILLLTALWFAFAPLNTVFAEADKKSSPCGERPTTICTIEIWLAHKQKKQNREIRKFLKSQNLKVLRHTIQYWKPKGGHPPTNVAIGSGLSAEDARLVMKMAIKYNDKIESLVLQALNPPNYAAIATSAWDEKSQIPVSPEELEKLMDESLTTEEFHKLYITLTKEENYKPDFY